MPAAADHATAFSGSSAVEHIGSHSARVPRRLDCLLQHSPAAGPPTDLHMAPAALARLPHGHRGIQQQDEGSHDRYEEEEGLSDIKICMLLR